MTAEVIHTHTCQHCGVAYTPQVVSARNKFCSRLCKGRARIADGRSSLAVRTNLLKKKYGLTRDDYQAIWDAQNGACKLCGTTDPQGRVSKYEPMWLHVDHDHETGAIRGLLCSNCNTALGKFRDDPALLRKAAEYLEET